MYICIECWNESLKWSWQCPFCKSWSTLKEFKKPDITNSWKKAEVKELKKISEIENEKTNYKIKTSSQELNNVLWWWITPWWVSFITWEPWIWKSTITLQIASWVADKKTIYISWEETINQVSSRAKRLNIYWENIELLSERNIENIIETISKNKCDILIIDSISVMHSSNISSISWSISQIKYITELLVTYAKNTNTSLFIIWHVNKDWDIAWPKTLEHMVDTVLYLEWEKYDNLRILKTLKNRFGNTSEIWIFKMEEEWLKDFKNPGLEFISDSKNTIGSSLAITIEWTKTLVIETEWLTTYTKFWYPKRSARWINSSKLDLIIAVLSKYTKISLESYDVYTNISRWLKISEPWIDLAIAASIISSKLNKVIPKDIVFIWEISLTWNIKKVIQIEKRIKEAEKMGFKKIFLADCNLKSNTELIKLKNVSDLEKNIGTHTKI